MDDTGMGEPRYNVSVTLDITDADGNPYFSDKAVWSGVRYIQAVAVEEALSQAMAKLIDMSYAAAEQRGADPQEVAFVKRSARGE